MSELTDIGCRKSRCDMCASCGFDIGHAPWCPANLNPIQVEAEQKSVLAGAKALQSLINQQESARVEAAGIDAPEAFGAKGLKPTNPKDIVGSDKIPLHMWPETATLGGALALLDGALKYGRTNWRFAGVKASIYFDAAKRHLNAWFDEGEDEDPDSGLDHLFHALASIAILIDAKAAGKLTDDRMIHGGYRKLVEELTPMVSKLKSRHQGRNPKHYTIEDSADTK